MFGSNSNIRPRAHNPRRCGGAAIRPYRVIILPMKKDSFIRRIYTGDNLPILRGMDSETADLIYLDLPFNSGKLFAGENFLGGLVNFLKNCAIMVAVFFIISGEILHGH